MELHYNNSLFFPYTTLSLIQKIIVIISKIFINFKTVLRLFSPFLVLLLYTRIMPD